MNALGLFIAERRKRLRMTQSDLGRRLGVHGQFISNIERGVAPLPVQHWARLAGALSTTPDRFVALALKDYRAWLEAQLTQ